MNINDIAPKALWDEMIETKMISVQAHPTLPLWIYNYSQVAQFSKTWNAATLAARGLIVGANGEIVSKPFGKFFNYGELDAAELETFEGPVEVSDKLDGSMGVGYVNPETGKLNIATRGSFASDQALHATKLYLERYDGKWEPRADSTYIWEIIYPENRIVLDYGGKDDLMLIGRVSLETGLSAPLSSITEWPFERAQVLQHETLVDALNAPPRENAEGVVVHFTGSDERVKIKQEDYVRLHRVVTGVTARRVWEILKNGDDLDGWLADLPEEFAVFIRSTADELVAEHDAILDSVTREHARIVSELDEGFTQRDFALAVNAQVDRELRGLVFGLQAGRKLDAWKMIRPEHIPLTGWGGAEL